MDKKIIKKGILDFPNKSQKELIILDFKKIPGNSLEWKGIKEPSKYRV